MTRVRFTNSVVTGSTPVIPVRAAWFQIPSFPAKTPLRNDAAVSDAAKSKVFVDMIAGFGDIIDGNEGQPRTGKSLFDGVPMGKNPLAPSSDDRMADTDRITVMGIVPNGSPIAAPKDQYCRICGARRKENAKFCTECGAKFD